MAVIPISDRELTRLRVLIDARNWKSFSPCYLVTAMA
jgi:hypothetical protein